MTAPTELDIFEQGIQKFKSGQYKDARNFLFKPPNEMNLIINLGMLVQLSQNSEIIMRLLLVLRMPIQLSQKIPHIQRILNT